MRIALISSSFDPYTGGVEEHTKNVARELSTRHQVEVWTVDRGEHLGVREVGGVTVRYLPTPLPSMTPFGVPRFLSRAPNAWRAWRSAHGAFQPDILHVHCFGPNGPYSWALGRATGTPVVVSAHGETFMDEDDIFGTSRLMRASLRRAIKDAAAVTGCSTMVIRDLQKRFGLHGGHVVPNGVALDEVASQGNADSFPQPYIFAVGRMVHVKGFDLLVEAFARADFPDEVRLVIGGEGPTRHELRQLARGLGVSDRLVLPGRLERADVIAGMANAELIVVPSRVEAFGIVVLEAWRSGTPLIATSNGGPSDLIQNGVNGILVDPTDTHALSQVLEASYAHLIELRSLTARGAVSVQDFTWSSTAGRYETIYNSTNVDKR